MTAKFLVSGEVQGVGFRWFARVAARRLELKGWVRNLDDGSVEVAAAGSQERLDMFRRQLGQGPEGAQVASMEESEHVGEDLDSPFIMRR